MRYTSPSQPPHKVNLGEPKKCILVQLFKSMCCLAVVDDFRALSRFNLRELCAEHEVEGGGNAKVQVDGGETGKGGEKNNGKDAAKINNAAEQHVGGTASKEEGGE